MDLFLQDFFKSNDYRISPLAGDASSRKYYRIISQQQSWVLMQWEPFNPESYPFLSVLNHFKQSGVHVPQVVAVSGKEGLLLLEDLGDLTLERKFWENQNQEVALPYYKKTLDEILKVHFLASKNKGPCTAFGIQFDTEKLLWELNYGFEHLVLGVLKFIPKNNSTQKIFLDICEKLNREPKFIAHRDYHSRNVMLKFDEVVLIDFQDARMGAIQYDLVSLLRDSYVNISDEIEQTLLNYYLERAASYLPKDFSREHFDYIYNLQTIQRCFKACGSFASFYQTRGDTRYLKYLLPTLRRVIKSVSHFPEYKDFASLLIDSGALEKKYEQL